MSVIDDNDTVRHWWQAGLDNLTHAQWERLCDGCGLCCLHKLQDEETGDYHYTQFACDLLNIHTCQCSDYDNRFERVPGCMKLTPENYTEALPWLPSSCAYKRVAEGEALPSWHHLLTGSRSAIHELGASVSGRVRYAAQVPERDYQEHLLQWVDIED